MNDSGMIFIYLFAAILIALMWRVRAKKVSDLTDQELKERANEIYYTGWILGGILVGLAIGALICSSWRA